MLDLVVIIEFLGLALGCGFFAYWKRPTNHPRWWLIVLGVALFLLPFVFLGSMKGDGDGLYVLAQVPLAILLAGPSFAAALGGYACWKSDQRERSG